jgi:pimeloyl-ACP methyl ester carboxylesterase
MIGQFIETSGIRLHFIDHPGGEPTLVLLPGLSATAPIFEDLIAAGLSPPFRTLALDLRGRGRSGAPPAGFDPKAPALNYTMADHAADVLGLLDALKISQPVLVGHSFGGLLALFLAARHPERFCSLVVLDAAMALATPKTRDLLGPMLARLGALASSWDEYKGIVSALPYLEHSWSPSLERYYRSYVHTNPDGSVRQLLSPPAILASVEAILAENWGPILSEVLQPVLLINAVDPYGPPGAPAFLPRDRAMETVRSLSRGRYVAVSGNHITMLFNGHARQVAAAICAFVTASDGEAGED